jgi:hypothetical protein
LKVSPAVPTSAVARPEEKSTPLDFAQFRIKRIAGVFEYPMIEGEIGFTRLKISFGWNSPDRVFAHFNDRQFATLAIDQMRQLEKVLVHWHQNPANQPTESSRGMLEAVSRAASLSEVKRAVVASGAELSDRGTFVSGGEAKALVDSAMTDGKIEGLENAMILVAYHRALEANTWTSDATKALQAAVTAGTLSWSTEIGNVYEAERILDGTPEDPNPL